MRATLLVRISRLFVFTLLPAIATPALATMPISDDIIERDAQAELHLMAGELAAGRQQLGTAAYELLLALRTIDDKDLASRATTYALGSGDPQLILAAAQRWLQLDPNALDAHEIVLRMALARNDAAETQRQADAIVAAVPDKLDDALLQIARMLVQGGPAQGDTALQVMTQLTQQYPDSGGGQHGLALVALRYGKLDLADSASRTALEREPDNRERQLLRVGTLVKLKRLDESDKGMSQILANDSQPDELRMGYVKLLIENGDVDRARAQLQTMLDNDANNPDAIYAMGVLDLDEKKYDAAESRFKLLLDGPRELAAAFQLGRLSETRKDYAAAADYYARINQTDLAVDAAIRRAYSLAALKRYDEAQAVMAELRTQLPMLAPRFQQAEAELLMENGAGDRALKLLNAAITAQPKDIDLLYTRSIAYERQRKIALAEKDLRTMIANNARDARALNALGYMLTVHTQRYSEARTLIEKAKAINPDDAAITDSLGWVMFKLGKKTEALTLLQSAYDKFADPEVAAHLGEVMWASGDKTGARTVWDKALKDAPDHETLNETIQRLSK